MTTEPLPHDLVRRIVEAALFAAPQPQSLAQLAALFPDDAPAPPGTIEQALQALADEAPQRGVELIEVASGFRFQIRAEVQPWVARLWAERQARYSRALLETLALIAYRQPITRGEIEQIRGVAVSTQIVRTLEEREWVRVVGHRDVPGKPALYGTTRGFLDYFGLKSLDELPPLTELHEIPELEPQLPFEAADRAPLPDAPFGVSTPIGFGSEAAVDEPGDEALAEGDAAADERAATTATDSPFDPLPGDAAGSRADSDELAAVVEALGGAVSGIEADPVAVGTDAEPAAGDSGASSEPPAADPSSRAHASPDDGAAGTADEPSDDAQRAPAEHTP
jgi:segregation and condensation protein B